MLRAIEQFERWLRNGQCVIRDKSSLLCQLHPNRTQQIILHSAKLQAEAGKPIRQKILKARKHGVTTLWQSFMWWRCGYAHNQIAMFMAHREDDTRLIFEVVKRIADNHQVVKCRGTEPMKFTDSGSIYWAMTAGGENVGAGGTPTMLHLSEVALLPQRKKMEMVSATQAVPYQPGTVLAEESTARGHEQFYEGWMEAHDPSHPSEPLFFPWFFDAENCLTDCDSATVFDDEETVLIRYASTRYGIDLSDGQLAWRRMKILEIGPNLFRQEFPATPEEAVRSHRGLVLPGLSSCVIDDLPFLLSEIPWNERVGGYDPGYSDPTALGSGIYRDQILYVIRVYRGVKTVAEDFAGEVIDGHTYYCDPANPGQRDQLRRDSAALGKCGCHFVQAPRAKGTGRSITKEEWEIVRRWVVDGRIMILKGEHEQLCAEADTLSWNDTTGEPNMTRTPQCGHFDTLDMLRYMVMGVARSGAKMPRRVDRPQRIRKQLRM